MVYWAYNVWEAGRKVKRLWNEWVMEGRIYALDMSLHESQETNASGSIKGRMIPSVIGWGKRGGTELRSS